MSLDYILDSPIITAIMLFLALFSILLTIKTIRKKEISYIADSHSIIEEWNFSRLKVLFDKEEVGSLTLTTFVIWNSGNACIKEADIVDSIKIGANQEQILDARIHYQTGSENKFQLIEKMNEIQISFDHIEKAEGVIIFVFHTGKIENFSVFCKVKDGKFGIGALRPYRYRIFLIFNMLVPLVFLLLVLGGFAIVQGLGALIGMMVIFGVPFVLSLFWFIEDLLKNRVPKNLKRKL